MANIRPLSAQRQQAVMGNDPRKLVTYAGNQRQNLQRDWKLISDAINNVQLTPGPPGPQGPAGPGAIPTGLLSALPAPGNAGAMYGATDTNQLFWDNGTSWVGIA